MLTPENLKEFRELEKRYRKLKKKADKYKWVYYYQDLYDTWFSLYVHGFGELIKSGWAILTPKGWIWQDIPAELMSVKTYDLEDWMKVEIQKQHDKKWSSDFDFAIKEAMEYE